MSKTVHIIGGGVVGLSSAWYLHQAGYDVTVINNSGPGEACSYGNAGYVSPSHFVPLAAPGMIAKGLAWMFRSDSPFYIHPRLSPDLLRWTWQFYRNSTPAKVKESMPVMRDIMMYSRSLYEELSKTEGFNFDFDPCGLLMLVREKKALQEEIETAEMAHAIGMQADILNPSELAKLDPTVKMDVLGGVHYPSDVQIYPNKFMADMIAALHNKGVHFIQGTVSGFGYSGTHVSEVHLSDGQRIPVSEVVAAAGSRTAILLKHLGFNLLMQDGKGYSVTLPKPGLRPRIPAILHEARVAISPMGEDLRIGGTLEISNHKTGVSIPRVKAILKATSEYYPELSVDLPPTDKIWYGYRPFTPDGMAYIGKSRRFGNLTLAAGHAMLGLSMGTGTGKMVADILTGKKPEIDLKLFNPDRFG